MTCWHFDGPKPEKAVRRGQIPDCVLGPEAVWVPHSGFGVTVPELRTRRSGRDCSYPHRQPSEPLGTAVFIPLFNHSASQLNKMKPRDAYGS